MTNKKCEGIDCAWCMSVECPNEKGSVITDKEQIIIHGVGVSECEYVCNTAFGNIGCKLPFNEEIHCGNNPNCYYKQLQKEKFENLNNKQMVKSAENLIYENSELYKNLKEKERECEELKEELELNTQNAVTLDMAKRLYNYSKALEEIGGLVKNFCKDCDDYEDCNWDKEGCYYSLIPNLKDIINKAKGEG